MLVNKLYCHIEPKLGNLFSKYRFKASSIWLT